MRNVSVGLLALFVHCCGLAVGVQAQSLTIFVDPIYGSTENTGALAELTLEFSENASGDFLTLLLDNATDPALGADITALGLELPRLPGLAAVFAANGAGPYFDTLDYQVTVSPPWISAPAGYDIMLTSEGNFQGGSPQGAPEAGESETVSLFLGDTALTPVELADAFESFYGTFVGRFVVARFQAVGLNDEFSDMVGGDIPEPATLVLLVFGGLALVVRHRRRARAATVRANTHMP